MARLNLDSRLVRQCAQATGLTAGEVVAIAATGPRRYKTYQIAKRDGGRRTISQPSRELKALQYFFLNTIFPPCPVHPAAMAYVKKRSITMNAQAHAASRVILKTDFSDFFPSIRTEDWRAYARKQFLDWTEDDHRFASLVLFFGVGTSQPVCLSIGAPTSPAISNLMMWKFDVALDEFCQSRACIYTRYADDITISSREHMDSAEILGAIRDILSRSDVPRLSLNSKKTKLFSRKQALIVTGLVLSNQGYISLGRDRKRLISSMVYRRIKKQLNADEAIQLRGLLAFAQDAEPAFLVRLRQKYGAQILSDIIGGVGG